MSEKVWPPVSSKSSLEFRCSEYSGTDGWVTAFKDGLRVKILYVQINVQHTHTCTARNSCVLFNKCFHYWFTNLAGFPINVLKNEIDLNHLLSCFFFLIQKESLDRVLVSNPPLSRYTLRGSSSLLGIGMHLLATYNTAGAVGGAITLSPFSEWSIVSLS